MAAGRSAHRPVRCSGVGGITNFSCCRPYVPTACTKRASGRGPPGRRRCRVPRLHAKPARGTGRWPSSSGDPRHRSRGSRPGTWPVPSRPSRCRPPVRPGRRRRTFLPVPARLAACGPSVPWPSPASYPRNTSNRLCNRGAGRYAMPGGWPGRGAQRVSFSGDKRRRPRRKSARDQHFADGKRFVLHPSPVPSTRPMKKMEQSHHALGAGGARC